MGMIGVSYLAVNFLVVYLLRIKFLTMPFPILVLKDIGVGEVGIPLAAQVCYFLNKAY